MSYEQPKPSERRLALLERRPRRLGDINWREILAMISWSGAVFLPLAFCARFLFGAFEDTPLAWLPSHGFFRNTLAVFGAAGVGYLWFRLIGALLTGVVWVIFFVSQTPVRQDWLAGFLAGTVAVIATLPLAAATWDRPVDYLLGPALAIVIAQAPTTFAATRELKRFVRSAFWSADALLLVDRKSMNLQISVAALLGAMTVASLAMGLMRLSGLLEQPVSRVLIAGMALQALLLPGVVWFAHRVLSGPKQGAPPAREPARPRETPTLPEGPWGREG